MWAGFGALAAVFGILYGFGVVLEALSDDLDIGLGQAGALPALGSFVLFSVGPLSGRAADRHGTHVVVGLGAVSLLAGLGLTATTDSYAVALLGFGLGVGAACGLVYVPTVAHVAAASDAGAPLRVGVAVAGVGVGTAGGSAVLGYLIEEIGWRRAYLASAVTMTVVLAAATVVFRLDRSPGQDGVELPPITGLARSTVFRRHYAAMILMTPSLFVGLVFVANYGEQQGWSSGRSAALLVVIGLASIVGRVVLAAAGARLPVAVMYRGCYAALAVSCLIWAASGPSYPIMVVYAVTMGTAYGGFIGLAPLVAAEAFGRRGLGGVLGGLYTAIGVGGLVTGPVGGAAIDAIGYGPVLLVIGTATGLAVVIIPVRRPPVEPVAVVVS